MSNWVLVAAMLLLMAFAYRFGLTSSRKLSLGGTVRLHSRPGYYGVLLALWCGIPAFTICLLWWLFEPGIVRALLQLQLPPEMANLGDEQWGLLISRVEKLAAGSSVGGQVQAFEISAAERLREIIQTSQLGRIVAALVAAMLGLVVVQRRLSSVLRVRNEVEQFVRLMLMLCSFLAILTTVGIVISMLGEALHFFSFVPPSDFFFGTVWDPRFSSVSGGGAQQGQFGLLPLLWGTIMISIIALLIAVPVGLMTAIYLSEYASPRLRDIAKPVIEVLAGIPTIVYGFFALITVGPFFHQLGGMLGLEIRATSALTAGVVMGVMIIPFVSSLSDDIITQVPQMMRDGSLGLGATRSETIRKIVLPAALPGIVGAFLLAASRAIGETMIVVLAAGNSPILHANPFEAVSTVTVTIVNQLTGDLDFASPQSLVAFALGLTLFVMTLGLNVLALYIVRKYREQYE